MSKLNKVINYVKVVDAVVNKVYKGNPAAIYCFTVSNKIKAVASITQGGKVEQYCAAYFLGAKEPTKSIPLCLLLSTTMQVQKARRIGWVKALSQDLALEVGLVVFHYKEINKPIDLESIIQSVREGV